MLNHLRGIIESAVESARVARTTSGGSRSPVSAARTGSAFFGPQRPLMVYSDLEDLPGAGAPHHGRAPPRPCRGASLGATHRRSDRSARGGDRRPVRSTNGCRDISKSAVEAASIGAFGYGLFVDPRRHVGPYVMKSEQNGRHDGRVVEGPRSAELGFVYQRLVDNMRRARRRHRPAHPDHRPSDPIRVSPPSTGAGNYSRSVHERVETSATSAVLSPTMRPTGSLPSAA